MRKSIIPILLCVIMLFCACKPTVEYTVSPNAVKYKYHTFKGTDWGMTKEECMKALEVKEKELMPLNKKYKEYEEDNIKISGFSIEKNVYGNPATISCIFITSPDKAKLNLGLIQIYVDYEEDCNNQVIYDGLYKSLGVDKLDKHYEMGIDIKHIDEEIISEGSFKTIDDKEISQKGQKFINFIPNDMDKNNHKSFTYIKFLSEPNKGTVIYYRGWQAAILHSLLK